MKFKALILLAFLLGALLPIPTAAQLGTFNLVSHLAYCRSLPICQHELAHALDQQAGWVSQSPEFYKALQMYLFVELHKPQLTAMPVNILELTYRSGDDMAFIKMELYAYLFQWAQGNPERVPDGLRSFYDWQTAARWLATLKPGQTLYWFY